ncbi:MULTISPECIES: sporulation delaying protein family toxin [Streptomyces]|uniref:sporulation delaying protein family toxin n=1 Tax=Streptomyces TaxID=1883 RepID=UPI00140D09C0|nr:MULTISPECIES: sporulation delaying protein family toxin [Streptomyces]MDH6229327.1 SdpC family antimicrobial peptide [Streptomyces sp. MJP52]
MHRRVNIAVAAVAALGLGATVAQQAVATPKVAYASTALAATPEAKAKATQDGRALFEGLAFAQGPVAEELADSGAFVDVAALREKNSTADQRRAVAGVLNKIQKERPQFFASFGSKLRSGDPRQVESGIAEAGNVLKALVSSTSSKEKAVDPGTGTGQCATVVLAVNVLVAVNLGGAVNVSVAVNLQAAGNVVNALNFWSAAPQGESTLTRDEQIAELTQVLAA